MLVTNLTANTFVLGPGVVLHAHAVDVSVDDSLYTTHSDFNRQIDSMIGAGLISVTGKPADPFLEAAVTKTFMGVEADGETTFSDWSEIDLAGPGLVMVHIVGVSADADGETFDTELSDPDKVWAIVQMQASEDGGDWRLVPASYARVTAAGGIVDGGGISDGTGEEHYLIVTPRYARVRFYMSGGQNRADSDGYYDGPNNPTVTANVTLVPSTTRLG